MGPSFVMAALAGLLVVVGIVSKATGKQVFSVFQILSPHRGGTISLAPVRSSASRGRAYFLPEKAGNLASFPLLWYSERH